MAHAYIFNPLLSADDLLRTILTDFGIREVKHTRGEMLQQFNEYLIDVYRRGGVTALVIDEAHLLAPALLEEIRLMTNIETSQHKLLQIVLVGQPELDENLDSPELRQVKQRVALRYYAGTADRYGGARLHQPAPRGRWRAGTHCFRSFRRRRWHAFCTSRTEFRA